MARSPAHRSSVSRSSVLREPTVPILLAACIVHVVRRDAVDFAVFFGTAVLIVAGAGRQTPPESARAARPVSAWLLLAGMTVFAAAAALAAPASLGARLVMVATGFAALAVVLLHPGSVGDGAGSGHSGSPAGWPVWAAIGVAACLWELTSFVAQQVWPLDQDHHPAASDLIGPLLQTWLGRVVFLLLWAGAGWWLLRRFVPTASPTAERAADVPAHGAGRGGSARGERSEPESRHSRSVSRPDGHSEAER